MADLSDEDKEALLGPDFREIEARASRGRKSLLSDKWKGILIGVVVLAFASAVLLADFGFALDW